ncbi:uncharacterized protein LOC127371047 [Dicentrarchus labrax]|uniref:uncharacterized protein LOC127371047 n=1 Tax=Dicentrarchus labrax TaxID=13489 RepID=UPI0021F59084|nr:uncharacterized protein LOC127371047 [Dicentrarchus labrax]
MKTLCVAVIVLSLTSVCQPASLACEKLLKPEARDIDLLGKWYIVAISSESCWLNAFNVVFEPSGDMNFASKDTSNIYEITVRVKMHGYCINETESILYQNNTMFDLDVNNTVTGKPDKLMQSVCPDCIVGQTVDEDFMSGLWLLSRRQKVTAAELAEFEAQGKCLGLKKSVLFGTNHDYENCPSWDDIDMDDDDDDGNLSAVLFKVLEKMKSNFAVPLLCLVESINFYELLYEWAQETWTSLR